RFDWITPANPERVLAGKKPRRRLDEGSKGFTADTMTRIELCPGLGDWRRHQRGSAAKAWRAKYARRYGACGEALPVHDGGWVQVCCVAFCYLEYYRLRQREQSPSQEWWLRQRTKGLARQVLLDVEAADLDALARHLETQQGRRWLKELLRKAVPLEHRRPA